MDIFMVGGGEVPSGDGVVGFPVVDDAVLSGGSGVRVVPFDEFVLMGRRRQRELLAGSLSRFEVEVEAMRRQLEVCGLDAVTDVQREHLRVLRDRLPVCDEILRQMWDFVVLLGRERRKDTGEYSRRGKYPGRSHRGTLRVWAHALRTVLMLERMLADLRERLAGVGLLRGIGFGGGGGLGGAGGVRYGVLIGRADRVEVSGDSGVGDSGSDPDFDRFRGSGGGDVNESGG